MDHLRTVELSPSVAVADDAVERSQGKTREITSLFLVVVCFAGMLCMLLLSGCSIAGKASTVVEMTERATPVAQFLPQ